MWWFIGFIVLISIIFGVSLHEAFWGFVGTAAGLMAFGWILYTKSGRKALKIVLISAGITLGVIIACDGANKKINEQSLYESDIKYCQETQQGFYMDTSTNKFKSRLEECTATAKDKSKARSNSGILQTIIGGILVCFSISLWRNNFIKTASRTNSAQHKSTTSTNKKPQQ